MQDEMNECDLLTEFLGGISEWKEPLLGNFSCGGVQSWTW